MYVFGNEDVFVASSHQCQFTDVGKKVVEQNSLEKLERLS